MKGKLLFASVIFSILLSACGGGGGGVGTPTVTLTSPADNATNVAVDAVITAAFSEQVSGVDETTFTLKDASNNPVAGAVVYSGLTATFTPFVPLGCSATYTATLSAGIKDLSNNPLVTTSWSFTSSACGGGVGTPTVTITSPADNATNVAVFAVITAAFSEQVSGVDETTFALKDVFNNSVAGAVVYSGLTATFTPSVPLGCSATYTATLSAMIKDLASNSLATTSWSFTIRDISSWAYVNSTTINGINKNAAQNANYPQLTVLGSKLYAAWYEPNVHAQQIRVAVYNGNDSSPSWAFVDGSTANGINKNSARNAYYPQLTVLGSKLYATWEEYSGTNQIRVAVYNGNDSSPSWTFVDGNGTNGINKNAAQDAYIPQLTVLGSKLYATWYENNGTANQIRVAVYNGNDSSPSWAFVDGNTVNGINKNVAQSAWNPQLIVLGSKLHATWNEDNGTASQIRVAVYNGNDSSPSWAFVDGNGTTGINKNAAQSAAYPQLTVLGSKLYATWQEDNGTTDQIRAAVYNGNDGSPSWAFVDGNGTTGINKNAAQSANYPQLTVLGLKLYATWHEFNGTANQIWVAVGQ